MAQRTNDPPPPPSCSPTVAPPYDHAYPTFKVMTLTGNGDLILHQGSLLIKSPRAGIPTKNVGWRTETPPEALVVSGGSLGVAGGSAKITSSRSNAPALAVTVEGKANRDSLRPYSDACTMGTNSIVPVKTLDVAVLLWNARDRNTGGYACLNCWAVDHVLERTGWSDGGGVLIGGWFSRDRAGVNLEFFKNSHIGIGAQVPPHCNIPPRQPSLRRNIFSLNIAGGWGDGTESPYKTGFLAQEALPRYSGAAVDVTVLQPGSDQFRLLELSTLVVEEFGSAAEVHGHDTGQDTAAAMMAMTMRRNVLSVQGDGRISMAGGGGVVLEEGDLEVSQGDAKFKV